jgi:hypothetical protein
MAQNSSQLTVAQYQALIAGIQKYAGNATFMVASQRFTAAQAVTFLQTLHDTSAATAAAKAAWKQSLASDEAAEAQNGSLAREIRDTIAIMFSNAAATLQGFGMAPRKKPTPLTTAARAAANAKAAATREARGTKGAAQKAAITGNVTGVTITPVVTPTAGASTAPTPAAAASPPAASVTAPLAAPAAEGPTPAAPPVPAPVASNGVAAASSTAAHS